MPSILEKLDIKDDTEQHLTVSEQDAIKHDEAGTEEVAEEVIHALDDEEHDLDALAEKVLQDGFDFSQATERKEYKAITDEDLEDDDELENVLSDLEDSIGSNDTEITISYEELDKNSDIQSELSDLIAELDEVSDFDNSDIQVSGSIEDVPTKDATKQTAVQANSDYNINNDLASLEDDPDWEEVADTYQSDDNHDVVDVPPAEIGLSEETVEQMYEIDRFIVSHQEDYASDDSYIEADNLNTDTLLEEIEGRNLITKTNDEEEEEIL